MDCRKMDKKKYIAPTALVVKLNIESLLTTESIGVDSTHTVTNSNQVFSRKYRSFDDEEDYEN